MGLFQLDGCPDFVPSVRRGRRFINRTVLVHFNAFLRNSGILQVLGLDNIAPRQQLKLAGVPVDLTTNGPKSYNESMEGEL